MTTRASLQMRLLALLLGLIILVSCGGGGGIVGIDGSGSRLSVSSAGAINGFGSVIVNGVHYNTDSADIYIRGELSQESELNVGDYVVVVGSIDEYGEAIAHEVHYQPMVTGEIEWIDFERDMLSVLGQTILLLDDTTFSEDIMPRNVEGLSKGQTITVGGLSDSDHRIRATRVQLNSTANIDFVGKIESFSEYKSTYVVNGLVVDFTSVQWGVPPVIGDWVAFSGEQYGDGTLYAHHLNGAVDYRALKSVQNAEFSGFVSNMNSSGRFYIGRVPVQLSYNTKFTGGMSYELKANSKVRVEGALNADSILIASVVEFERSPDMKVFGTIRNINYPKWGEPYLGSIEVQDRVVNVGFGTRLVGDGEQRIHFGDLKVGDTVTVSGYTRSDTFEASSVTVDNRQFDQYVIELQGGAHSIHETEESFLIYGTKINISTDTIYSDGGEPLAKEEFFELLSSGLSVQVRGYYKGYVLMATSIQANPKHSWYYPPYPPVYVIPTEQ